MPTTVQRERQPESPGGYRETLRVALPLVASMASFTVMQFCDRLFLSWYSSVSIRAALPAGILAFTMICAFMALAGYAGTIVAQYHGAGDPSSCSRATAQGVWVALLSWPLILALLPPGRWLLVHAGHAPDVVPEELAYFTILMVGGVTVPLGAAVSGFFIGRGDTRTNMLASMAGHAVNAVLDYGLIFGRFGMPRLGITGAAIATVAAGVVTPAILLLIYFAPRMHARYGTRRHLRLEPAMMRRLLRFGLPSAWHMLADVGTFAAFVLLSARLEATALAASNIAFSINNLAFMPLVGLGMAASILVGQHQGAGRSRYAERAGWTALKLGAFYMVLTGVSFACFPGMYFRLFASGQNNGLEAAALLPVGRRLLLMMAAWGLMDAVNIILGGALKGAGDTRFVMLYSIIMGWVVWLGGEVLILVVFRRGIVAAWVWLMIYVWILAIGFFLRWRRGKWKAIRMIESPTPMSPAKTGAEAWVVVN